MSASMLISTQIIADKKKKKAREEEAKRAAEALAKAEAELGIDPAQEVAEKPARTKIKDKR
jgi:hypothetical protein